MRVMKYVKEQVKQDRTVVKLCLKMSETYITARKSEILARVEELKDIIQLMIAQTVECSVFIKGYIEHGFGRKFQIHSLQTEFLIVLNQSDYSM